MSLSVTVSILTYNGEQYLEAILSAIERQHYEGQVEVLVVDSGSTDRTLEIVRAHPAVRLHQIPNHEFGHGRTRNLVAQLASGDIVVYLTHDAVPATDDWLREMVAPFADDERVAAVLGKQIARPDAPPVLKYDIQRVFEKLGPDHGVTLVWDTGRRELSDSERSRASFYSDANSAARRDILLGPVPYRDVAYAEDQVFGRDLFDLGLRRAYAPRAAVEHSNDTTLRTFGSRVAADVLGLRTIGVAVPPMSRFRAFAMWVVHTLADTARIATDKDFSAGRKLYWFFVNPWYHVAKWSAYRRATVRRL